MRLLTAAGIAALALATTTASPALAQDATAASPRAPDGSRFFGFEPYVGIMGGYDSFDRRTEFNSATTGRRLEGAQVEGLLGANLPLGPLFIGADGFGAKGFGPINWEYGARGRAGLRIGDSGLIYGSVGYTWIDMKQDRGFTNRDDWVYGLGIEVGPKDIGLGGITGRAGPRLRLSAETYNLKSLRPMAGVVFHF